MGYLIHSASMGWLGSAYGQLCWMGVDAHAILITATSIEEALMIGERLAAGMVGWPDDAQAELMPTPVCHTCGQVATLTEGLTGEDQCPQCVVSGLQHGHLHGLHTDHEWDDDDRKTLSKCPDCRAACQRYDMLRK